MKVTLTLLKHQKEALLSKNREILMLGGIGVGKSHLLAQWVINLVSTHPNGCVILLCANVYQQLMQATVKALTSLLDECFIPHEDTLSGAKKQIKIGNTSILLYSLEKYDNIRGVEADYIGVDEACFAKYEAIQVLRGRLRGKNTKKHQILMCSSPNGFNWAYDQFNGTIPSSRKLIQAKTSDNTFLPEGTFQTLLEQYGGPDSPLAQQELLGQFVNLQSGAIYNMFDRKVNVIPCQLNNRYPVYVGVDFNIDQMSAVYVQYINNVFYLCKEVSLTHRDSNTFDLGQRIIQDLKGYQVSLIPDSTASSRKTSATAAQSDIHILKNLGLHVLDTQNPLIRDRQNTLNLSFKQKRCQIDPSCDKTIKEIETLSGRDKEGEITHNQVCLGYVLWKLNPLRPVFNDIQPRVIRS